MKRKLYYIPALLVLLSAPVLEAWLSRNRPNAPDVEQGFTVEHGARGRRMFLTPLEFWYLRLSLPLGVVLGAVAVKLNSKQKH